MAAPPRQPSLQPPSVLASFPIDSRSHSFLPSKFDIITSAGADGNATANDAADTTAAVDGDVVMANANNSSPLTMGYTTRQNQNQYWTWRDWWPI